MSLHLVSAHRPKTWIKNLGTSLKIAYHTRAAFFFLRGLFLHKQNRIELPWLFLFLWGHEKEPFGLLSFRIGAFKTVFQGSPVGLLWHLRNQLYVPGPASVFTAHQVRGVLL